jgi:Sec-independent protein translocase protein TatA
VLGIDMPEVLIIMAIALVVLGPEKLPDFALRVGRLVYQARQQYDEVVGQIRAEIERAQQEVQNVTGDLGLDSGAPGESNRPRLRCGSLGVASGMPATPAERLPLESALLGVACGWPVPGDDALNGPPAPREVIEAGVAAGAHANGVASSVERQAPLVPATMVPAPERSTPVP